MLTSFGGIEIEHQVTQSQDAARTERVSEAAKGDSLPEVRELVQSVAAIHEVDRRAVVLVRQEPGVDDGDVAGACLLDSLAQEGRHRR